MPLKLRIADYFSRRFYIYRSYFYASESMINFCDGIRTDRVYASYRTIRIASDCLGLRILVHKDTVKADKMVDERYRFTPRGTAHGALHILHTGPLDNGHFTPILFGRRLTQHNSTESLATS